MEMQMYRSGMYEVVKMPIGYGVRSMYSKPQFEAVCATLPFAISYADSRDRASRETLDRPGLRIA